MKLNKCDKAHFYDADRYEVCPHCAKNDAAPAERSTMYLFAEEGADAPPPSVPEDAPAPPPAPPRVEEAKTMWLYAGATESEPVVGWLVCVKGAYQGGGFTLYAGRNPIGRAADLRVPLEKEASVSRGAHAVITYEPQKRLFYLQAGESNGLTYLNDELVLTFAEIGAYDTVRLGEAVFVFIPLCGERFTWSDYL